jgi:DNA recombination protein RmuC
MDTSTLVAIAEAVLLVGLTLILVFGRKATGVEVELRRQNSALELEKSRLTDALRESEKGRVGAEAKVTGADQRVADLQATHARELETIREEQRKNLEQMKEAFGSLSAEALTKMQPAFLTLATQTLGKHTAEAKGDLQAREEAIKGLVTPLSDALKAMQAQVQKEAKDQAGAIGEVTKAVTSLTQQSSTLSGETSQLRRILSSSQARGRWGEETLRRCVEVSEMSVHCSFVEQSQTDDKKPDMIIALPGGRSVIVDSKVPDLDFLNALHESDDVKRAELLRQHADKLRGTIKALSDRDYPASNPGAINFVVLFLPAESLFSAALEGDPELIIFATQQNIMLATPTSLMALLKAVSLSWLQHRQAEDARNIVTTATEFFSRVATFLGHFDKIGAGLGRAVESYNDAMGSYAKSVRPQGERLQALVVNSDGKALPEVKPVDTTLRAPPAAHS